VHPEHTEKFLSMIHLVKQISAPKPDRQLNRSVSPKSTVSRLKTSRTQSFEILPPKSTTPTGAQATDASFTAKAEQKQFKDAEIHVPYDADHGKLLQELEEAKLKIRQLEETLQLKGGLVVSVFEENKRDTSFDTSKTTESISTSGNTELKEPSNEELGLSYDSWKVSSTLTNLDIEEMCRCLAKAVIKHIKTSLEIRESFSITLPDFFEDFTDSPPTLTPCESASLPDLVVSSFELAFNEAEAKVGVCPDESSVYNYCKNIILRCQMEREVIIVSLVYLERLVLKTGFRVNEANWKRLLFTALIVASKTWDDDSLENLHIAGVISMYSIRLINEMECVFLSLLDYSLVVRGSEYAKYYFILRTYSEQKARRFPLKALDVNTVRKLQSAVKTEVALKDLYREPLHKTK